MPLPAGDRPIRLAGNRRFIVSDLTVLPLRAGTREGIARDAKLQPVERRRERGWKILVGPAGLEPATLCLEGRCSIQLSYEPKTFQRNTPEFD